MRKHFYKIHFFEEDNKLVIRALFIRLGRSYPSCVCGDSEIVASKEEWKHGNREVAYLCNECLRKRILKAKLDRSSIETDQYTKWHLKGLR